MRNASVYIGPLFKRTAFVFKIAIVTMITNLQPGFLFRVAQNERPQRRVQMRMGMGKGPCR